MWTYNHKLVLILTLEMLMGALLIAGCVFGQQLSYSGNMQFATGNYFFDQTTSGFYLSNGITWNGKRTSVGINLPYIAQNSPWISYTTGGQLPTGGTQHGSLGRGSGETGSNSHNRSRKIALPDTSSNIQTSLGDPSLQSEFKIFKGQTTVSINSSLKFPITNPDNGFGTGAWDFGVGLSLNRQMGSYFLSLDGMYWWLGNMPDLLLKDPFSYSAGIGKVIGTSSKWTVLGTFAGYTEIIENIDPPMNVGIGIGHFINNRVGINTSAGFGLTESASDFSIGFGWNLIF